MFERFTTDARQVVVDAQREARDLGHTWIGTEHLLLAVLVREGSPVADGLTALGLTHAIVQGQVNVEIGTGPADGEALRNLGIDVDEVRRRVEASFGPGALDTAPPRPRRRSWLRRRRCDGSGHISFTPRAKKALELALRESIRLRSGEIAVAHLVLGLLRTDGMAARVVTQVGVDPDAVRRAVLDQIGRAA